MGSGSSQRYLPPRNSQLWLLAGLSAAMAPLLRYLPVWLVAVWAVVLVWRWQLFRGHWPQPNALTKASLVASSTLGLWLSYGRFQGLEPMVSLLLAALLLKWLEQRCLRDTLLVTYLGFVVIGLQFLFEQTLLMTLYAVLCLWLLLSALLSLHQPQGSARPKRTAMLAGRLLLHSVPLMLLMFLVMPRLGSLWAMPSLTHSAKTGMSDSMAPGDITRLSRSGGVAFRVDFVGEAPAQEQLYWRGLVLSDFDGRRWRQSVRVQNATRHSSSNTVIWGGDTLRRTAQADWLAAGDTALPAVEYRITLEATQQRWVYSLPLVNDFNVEYEGSGLVLGLTRDYHLMAQAPIRSRVQYSASSKLAARMSVDGLNNYERGRALTLPDHFNALTLETAERWRSEVDTDEAYIARLLAYYRSRFVYTLDPPALGRDSVDEFLWRDLAKGGQQGFCEHYASSFGVMMRAANIPARVVVGYQGGEYNQQGDYWTVHQYDAHAWAEVWLAGKGWQRVDPTTAVAPERVRKSLGDMQVQGLEGALSLGRYRSIAWVASMRMQWDRLNYQWHQAVMSFDNERQVEVLGNLLGEVSPLKMMLFVLSVGGGLLALVSLHLWWRARPKALTPSLRILLRFERLLVKQQLSRDRGEAPGDFARRAQSALPLCAPVIGRFMRCYQQAEYGGGDASTGGRDVQRELRGLLRLLRRQLKQL